jgi:hypothetical protein
MNSRVSEETGVWLDDEVEHADTYDRLVDGGD